MNDTATNIDRIFWEAAQLLVGPAATATVCACGEDARPRQRLERMVRVGPKLDGSSKSRSPAPPEPPAPGRSPRHRHWPVQAVGANRRRRHGPGVHGPSSHTRFAVASP
ncbi:MAG: hypothetical protein U0746_09330 [Gemmataceae bacterium]